MINNHCLSTLLGSTPLGSSTKKPQEVKMGKEAYSLCR